MFRRSSFDPLDQSVALAHVRLNRADLFESLRYFLKLELKQEQTVSLSSSNPVGLDLSIAVEHSFCNSLELERNIHDLACVLLNGLQRRVHEVNNRVLNTRHRK